MASKKIILAIQIVVGVTVIICSILIIADHFKNHPVMTTSQLEDEVVGNGWTNPATGSSVSVSKADCQTLSVDVTGTGLYDCALTREGDWVQHVRITVHPNGTWEGESYNPFLNNPTFTH